MDIEFNPAKDASNRRKHGLSLALAGEFDAVRALVFPAQEVRGEPRYKMIEFVPSVGLVTAIVTYRWPRVRVISLRRASLHERRRYEAHQDAVR